jgi:hypothetical protein
MSKTRKDRSDIQIGNLEKKHQLQSGTIRNPDQSDARSDKELGTLQREFGAQITDEMLESKTKQTKTGNKK